MAMGKFHGVMMPHYADRFARHLDHHARTHRWQHLTADAQRLAGKEFEYRASPRRFAYALGARFALLACE